MVTASALLTDLNPLSGSSNPSSPSHPSRPVTAAKTLVVLALVVLGTLDLVQHYRLSAPVALLLSLLRVAPIPLASARPALAWWVSLGAITVTAVASRPVSPAELWPWAVTTLLTHSVVLFLAGRSWRTRAAPATTWLLTMATGAIALLLAPHRGSWTGAIPMAVVTAAVLLTADAIRARRDTQRRLVAQEQRSDAEHARRLRLEERARIARDLHDIVAHHMSVISVQAESAPLRLAGVPTEASAEFREIAATARSSLTEMRRLLTVLRGEKDNESDESLHPQPGLDQLESLAANAARADVPVRLSVTATALPQAVALTVYRIVQEALSNVVRHAPGADTYVSVAGDARQVRVSVTNGPSPGGIRSLPEIPGRGPEIAGRGPEISGRGPEISGWGQGLRGMRERVGLLGGTLATGPAPDGGFVVEAMIPTGAEAP